MKDTGTWFNQQLTKMQDKSPDNFKLYHIAVVAPSVPPPGTGGVVTAHFHLARLLRRAGHQVTFLTYNEENPPPSEKELIRYGASRRLRWLTNLIVFFYLKSRGSNQMAYQLADILASAPGAWRMGRELRRIRPDFVIIPDQGAPGLLLPMGRWQTILFSHHNPLRFIDNPLLDNCCPKDAKLAVALEQKVVKRAAAVVCPSDYMSRVFRDTYTFEGLSVIIPNGIDGEFIRAIPGRNIRTELGMSLGAPVIYIPSAGSRLKGERYVFEIVRRLAALHGGEIAFYLSGTITNELRAELDYVPLNARLFMPGLVCNQENVALVKGCSFGISPTLIENFSMAFLEANCCGVPMVTFDVGGNSSLITPGVNGLLVPPMDVDSLISAAAKLFDVQELDKLQKNTMEMVASSFSYELVVSCYNDLFSMIKGTQQGTG